MYAEKVFQTLEFNKLLNIIASFSHSEATRETILKIRPFTSKDDILKRQSLINEIIRLSQKGKPLNISEFPDISGILTKVIPEGAVLEPEDLSKIRTVLSLASNLTDQIKDEKETPFLKQMTENLTGIPVLLSEIKRIIDSEGNILDTASSVLAYLRKEAKRLEDRIRKRLEAILRDKRISIFLQDSFITKRSGRWVIPVRMDSKGQVQGVVHDISKSGETAFIEPISIIGIANELENIIAEQRAEEIRILRNISSKIRQNLHKIEEEFRIIVMLDLLNSISIFSERLKMQIPNINESGILNLINSRHPLLEISFSIENKKGQVVPIDVSLGGNNTVMVITGPNAGGKTVTIKTIGLLVIMALSGMPIPADFSSSIPLIKNLLIDIGDEQSIDRSLSTFSAHISNIVEILKNSSPDSLVLIDELGTGTDPEEGSALACGILNELKEKRGLVFATTHLSEVKGFVHKSKGMINASMEFDEEGLNPLYKLRIGEPGRSYGIETAERFGLPGNIINFAKDLLGRRNIELDDIISDLNKKRLIYERLIKENEDKQRELEEKEKKILLRLKEIEERQGEILSKAYREASDIITNTKKEMKALLDELRQKKGEERQIIKKLADKERVIEEKISPYTPEKGKAIRIQDIKKGMVVYVRSIGTDVEVVGTKKDRVKVNFKGKEIEVPETDIYTKIGTISEGDSNKINISEIPNDEIPKEINIIGLRVDEAIGRLEPFINHCLLAGLQEVKIIHGIGTGALARGVREYLKTHPLIIDFRIGKREEGGSGVTIVRLSD